MYETLFSLAGLAMVGWLLLILLPRWWVTRRVAESAAFPIFLSLIYLVGIVAVLRETGPGIMADFGSAEGVLELLTSGPVALVAWIHILAFDHLVGVLIYRDNMKHRIVALPIQSVLLLATLMFGPVGFLGYWFIRVARTRNVQVAWGDPESEQVGVGASHPATEEAAARPTEEEPTFRSVVRGDSPLDKLLGVWRREGALVGLGLLGFAFAAVTAGVAAVNGGWLMEPEGRLLEAVKFDVAVGLYVLTLALIFPFAPFREKGRRRWVRWMVGITVFSYAVESIQAWRGLDPRFSVVAGPADQMLGGVFFLAALGIMVLFIILMASFFGSKALRDHIPLRLAFRYAAAAAMLAFGVGIVMSLINTRMVGEGDLMLIHAGGFHALQAVPVVALLLGAGIVGRRDAALWTHVAGMGWLVVCVGLTAQAFLARPIGDPSVALAGVALGALVWAAAFGRSLQAWRTRRREPPAYERRGRRTDVGRQAT